MHVNSSIIVLTDVNCAKQSEYCFISVCSVPARVSVHTETENKTIDRKKYVTW